MKAFDLVADSHRLPLWIASIRLPQDELHQENTQVFMLVNKLLGLAWIFISVAWG